MELPFDLYEWLYNIMVLSDFEIKEKKKDKVVLEEEATQIFKIGLKMPLLFQRLHILKVFKLI